MTAQPLSPPTWTVPAELCRRLANPNGIAFLVRALMQGAVLKPEATVSCRGGRFVAEFHFEQPIGPEHQTGVLAQLGVLRGAST